MKLLNEGEISAEVAKQIERDLFEPRDAGEPPNLRDDAWERHLQARDANVDHELFDAARMKAKHF